MEQVLGPAEMKALREKARGKRSAVRSAAEAPEASRFDPQQLGQLSPDQDQGIQAIHKICARQMGAALSTILRTSCDVEFASIEQIPCAGYFERFPDPLYLASLTSSLDARVLLQLDLPVVFPMLDLILGGSGKEDAESRELTEIEQEIFEPVARILCRELTKAWQAVLKIDFEFEKGQQRGSASWISSGDKLLLAAFQIRMDGKEGKLHLAFPSLVVTALLRKMLPQEPLPKPAAQANRGRLRENLLESVFEAEMILPHSTVSIRELYELEPGNVLVLKVRSTEPVKINVAGQNMFLATPARCGTRRGALVQRVLSIIPKEEGKGRK